MDGLARVDRDAGAGVTDRTASLETYAKVLEEEVAEVHRRLLRLEAVCRTLEQRLAENAASAPVVESTGTLDG